jgi:hypothetical protein
MRSIFLLAMNRNCCSDVTRASLLAKYGRVVTVSESDVLDRGEHLGVDFKYARGWRRVLQVVREHRLVTDEVIVLMDYFFLLDSYWAERYNLDWLTYKVPALLAAGATRVILPRTAAMQNMENAATIRGVPVREWDNPLWVATEQVGVQRGRGEHKTHVNRLLSSAPFMEYTPSHLVDDDRYVGGPEKVLAGRYCPRKGKKRRGGACYQIWWLNKTVTWEPKWCLETLDRRFLDKMHSQQGKRVKFTGSKGVELGIWFETIRPCGLGVNPLPWGTVSPVIITHQKHGSLCALNSVANGISVPAILYDALFAVDPPLEQVVNSLNDKVGVLTKVSVSDTKLMPWLLAQKEGVYAVESDGHCITWDCDRGLLLDTDPRFPSPLPATSASLVCMGFTALLKAYRLDPPPPRVRKRRKKRKKMSTSGGDNDP